MIGTIDRSLLIGWGLLCLVGLVFVVSSSVEVGDADQFFMKHLVYLGLSVLTVGVVVHIPLRFWEMHYRKALFIALALLAVVLIPQISGVVNGSRRWIPIGPAGIQPAEIAKFLCAIYIAGYVARSEPLSSRWSVFLRPIVWIGAALLLIIAQPDFGSVVLLAVMVGAVLFVGGARMSHFLTIAVAAVVGLALAAIYEPYRIARLVSFMDPWVDALGSGYQLTQALIAFGRGHWFGAGLGASVQKLDYLPEPHNDFIFAVVVEEVGVVGGIVLLALLLFVAIRMLSIAHRALREKRVFAGCVAYGAGILIGVQTLFHVGVNAGVLPTKGLTLPFVSYGGNSLIICSALVAIALRVAYEHSRDA